MKLVSANRMIRTRPGTFFMQLEITDRWASGDGTWASGDGTLTEIINQFKKDPYYFNNEIMIFGDNSFSISFDKDEKDNINAWDFNVVGDACPFRELYIVFDDIELPENIWGISRGKALSIRDNFLNEFNKSLRIPISDDDWQIKALSKYLKEGSMIDVNEEFENGKKV